MRITRLQLHNFLVFDDLDLALDPSTVLVGPNDAGKSTILRALRLVSTDWRGSADGVTFRDVASDGRREPRDVVYIIAIYGDLSPAEREANDGLLTPDAELRFGKIWHETPGDDPSAGYLHWVTTPADRERVAEWLVGDWPPRAPFASDIDERGLAYFARSHADALDRVARRVDGELWIPNVDLYEEWPLGARDTQDAFWNALPSLVHIPGPDDPPTSLQALLRPIVRAQLRRRLSDLVDRHPAGPDVAFGEVERMITTADEVRQLTSDALDKVIHRYRSGARARIDDHPHRRPDAPSQVIESLIGDLSMKFGLDNAEPMSDLSELGAGTRRAALLAALDLYADPAVWPDHLPVTILVEEPEIGLHPGAQRTVAKSLARLGKGRPQVVLVTHSPTFVSEFPTSNIRLVQADPVDPRRRRVIANADLDAIATGLDISTTDVFLARRFVLVEGDIDVAVFTEWAHSMGIDFRAVWVRLLPAGGESWIAPLQKFMAVAYPEASFFAVFDGGPHTKKKADELRREFGGRVLVESLTEDEIEKYFSRGAVREWLFKLHAPIEDEHVRQWIDDVLSDGVQKETLHDLAHRYFGRRYNREDAQLIASRMELEDINPEIQRLLRDLAV